MQIQTFLFTCVFFPLSPSSFHPSPLLPYTDYFYFLTSFICFFLIISFLSPYFTTSSSPLSNLPPSVCLLLSPPHLTCNKIIPHLYISPSPTLCPSITFATRFLFPSLLFFPTHLPPPLQPPAVLRQRAEGAAAAAAAAAATATTAAAEAAAAASAAAAEEAARPISGLHGNRAWTCSARGAGRSVSRSCTSRRSSTSRVCCKVRMGRQRGMKGGCVAGMKGGKKGVCVCVCETEHCVLSGWDWHRGRGGVESVYMCGVGLRWYGCVTTFTMQICSVWTCVCVCVFPSVFIMCISRTVRCVCLLAKKKHSQRCVLRSPCSDGFSGFERVSADWALRMELVWFVRGFLSPCKES